MNMDNKSWNIYELITNLMEKQLCVSNFKIENVNRTVILKKLRSKAFEVLLKKKISKDNTEYIPSSSDIICNLLAWQFKNKNQPDKCADIKKIIKRIEELNIFKDEIYKNTTLFLLYLQDSVEDRQQTPFSKLISNDFLAIKENYLQAEKILKLNLSSLHLSDYNTNTKSSLKLSNPTSLIGFNFEQFSTKSIFLYEPNPLFGSRRSIGTEFMTVKSDSDLLKHSNTDDESNKLSLNEISVENLDRSYYNWEYLDNLHIQKESPFVCEAGPNILNLFQKIINTYTCRLMNCTEMDIKPEIISKELFIKDVKFMLVGTCSEIFNIDENHHFQLKKAIFIEGISVDTLKSYCSDLMFIGTCFRSLTEICTIYGINSRIKCGYIFKELCESIKRYLAFYRVVVLSLPNTISLLSLHKSVLKMRDQIGVLARIMKVSPFAIDTSTYVVPHSSALLTYLYEELINVTDKDLTLILYSAFHPCCQIYFQKFLQRWLFDGILVDPYEEFFIKVNNNYTKYRSRVYWTKHFSLKQIPLPGFLLELKNNILLCGKTMNLLKLCKPDISLCKYVIDPSLPLVNCCLTSQHLSKSKDSISEYYIEAASLCGPRISLAQKLREREEEQLLFLSKVQQKQALTLRRIELQRQQEAEEKAAKKRKIYEELKEQIRIAEAFRMKQKEEELKRDLILAQKNAELEEKKTLLLKQEAANIIKYYDDLFLAVDDRRARIENRKEKLQNYIVNQTKPVRKIKDDTGAEQNEKDEKTDEDGKNVLEIVEKSSTPATSEDYYDCVSVDNEEYVTNETNNLDMINANVNDDVKKHNKINEAFEEARRNKAKIMNLEFGVEIRSKPKRVDFMSDDNSNLTEAQKNKMKVMRSDYQVYLESDVKDKDIIIYKEFEDTDNLIENFNENMASPGQELVMNAMHRKNILSLPKHIQQLNIANNEIYNNIEMYNNINKSNTDNDIPMSIGSTPNTESFKDFRTPSTSKLFLSTELNLDSAPTIDTANSIFTDDGFKFPSVDTITLSNKTSSSIEKRELKISKSHANSIFNCNIRHLLSQSVFIPLQAQMKLVNNEIIKFFLIDQKFFSHLHSLRCYFFLLDGEFGRHITDGLFNKLYQVKKPIDLLNGRCLQLIMNRALSASSKVHENSELLSFTIQDIPQKFDLSSADVLDTLSMSYKIAWPLNILLPSDTIEKYQLVFKYLLKLHHISWILQKMFQELKVSSYQGKEIDSCTLTQSSQYHHIQLYRHVMTHFIQTLQNYTVSEVLQASWEELEHNMETVNTLDQLYTVHVIYVKTIIFRCLLNKQCAPIMKVINEIFVVILKFYNQLKSKSWKLSDDNELIHPSYKKLEDIFKKFEEYTNFVFRVGNKMARVGYQPHLVQMLDMLNMNSYYMKNQ